MFYDDAIFFLISVFVACIVFVNVYPELRSGYHNSATVHEARMMKDLRNLCQY